MGNDLLRWLEIRRWRKTLNIKKHARAFQALYNDINGFILSKQARSVHDSPSYLYGEIVFESFIALLSQCHPTQDTVFYDLGSGVGKAVIAAGMVFNIKKSVGIELFPTLNHVATAQISALKKHINYQTVDTQFNFINNDFLLENFVDATLIFINATAFLGDYWRDISIHLEHLKSGTHVITTSKAMLSNQFVIIKEVSVLMSWGVVTAYIQQKC